MLIGKGSRARTEIVVLPTECETQADCYRTGLHPVLWPSSSLTYTPSLTLQLTYTYRP